MRTDQASLRHNVSRLDEPADLCIHLSKKPWHLVVSGPEDTFAGQQDVLLKVRAGPYEILFVAGKQEVVSVHQAPEFAGWVVEAYGTCFTSLEA